MKTIFISLTFYFIAGFAYCQPKAIHVIRSGKGQPVLFLPGFTTPGSVWNETIKNLQTKTENHVISYAGFNGLPAIDTPWYAAIKEELIRYILKEKLNKLTIIGHSMGGTLAMDIAVALPLQVNKLILVDALPSMRDLMMPGIKAEQIQYNTPYNNQVLQMKEDAFNNMAKMMGANMTAQPEKFDTLTKWILEADRKTYVYGYTDLLKVDLREALKQVKAKTLILGASFPSKEIAKATFEKQYANLQVKTIEMADDSKHFIMFDQSEWFYEKVNAFIRK